jgi:hypothetical protein
MSAKKNYIEFKQITRHQFGFVLSEIAILYVYLTMDVKVSLLLHYPERFKYKK